jgi:hypothetical protein
VLLKGPKTRLNGSTRPVAEKYTRNITQPLNTNNIFVRCCAIANRLAAKFLLIIPILNTKNCIPLPPITSFSSNSQADLDDVKHPVQMHAVPGSIKALFFQLLRSKKASRHFILFMALKNKQRSISKK